ncbi:hypothetical protein NEOLEDRAFT_1075293 [Neolentinus lepideus HHB14362 ss-1]|uniref:Uncharacterized protein n=1 Tax=Neolentinus lepideus HHB14362 ss-1 TaxID=1314782 RepID=A0A165P8H4_9AGAM|nr:hypothetical protein NEOLEDRAFT_1075293 [Neolentinus lepideus HHB14362 ss-1]
MDPQLHPTKLQLLLDNLTIPEEFTRYANIEEADTISKLEKWKIRACDVLSELKKELEDQDVQKLAIQEQAEIVSKVVAFETEDAWAPKPANEFADDILHGRFFAPSPALIECILTERIRPPFRASQHPMLNPATGRKLPRPVGTQDFYYYEGQVWKRHLGIENLLAWSVRNIPKDAYERLWHLILPPMMTLLDDYEAPYKLRGIRVVSHFLARAPPYLLQRTGVDGLLFSSLRTTLTNLHNPTTPSLIRAAVPTLLTLIQQTTKPGSTERFNQLCVLLGESMIGSIWLYAANDKDTVEASVEVLPGVVNMLRVGCVRYLKAIIPQLTHPLLADSPLYYTTQHKLLSLAALRTTMQACAPRMHRWKEVVLEGVAKCWVVLTESDVMPENGEVPALPFPYRF